MPTWPISIDAIHPPEISISFQVHSNDCTSQFSVVILHGPWDVSTHSGVKKWTCIVLNCG